MPWMAGSNGISRGEDEQVTKLDIVLPDKYLSFHDSLGIHKVKVFNDLRILNAMFQSRIKARWKHGKPGEDSWYLVCSAEGGGKSTLILHAADCYDAVIKELSPDKFIETPIENITMNIKDFEKRMHETQREAFLAMDEASELSSDRMSGKESREFKQKLTIIRFRLFMGFIAFTNPMHLGYYFREDRVRGVFILKHPGVAYYYANSPQNPHFTDILERWEKDNKTKSIKRLTNYAPDFIMRYPDYNGRLWKAYLKRKEQNADKIMATNIDIEGETEGMMLPSEAAERAHVSKQVISKWMREGKLASKNVGIKTYIAITDLDTLIANRVAKRIRL